MTEAPIAIGRALISVSDKSGVIEFARFLAGRGTEILSTGGSAKVLADAGVPVKEVSAHTGFPEILDGRVKTLHPRIHGGLLARRDLDSHVEAMTDYGIQPIDLLVANLYPFEATVAKGADFDICVENIDIGGPAMIRAAAKNHAFVAVVVDSADYEWLMQEIASQGGTTGETRRHLAAKAYARTASYDAAIASWFAGMREEAFPDTFTLAAERVQTLRYGENPHQSAALYRTGPARPGVTAAKQIQGKELSYNNINDTDAAFELVAEFDEPAVAIVKHANPCGVALGRNPTSAFRRALACDPVSAFGGIIAVNRPIDRDFAAALGDLFLEVLIAPEIEPDAAEILTVRKSLRILVTGAVPDPAERGLQLRSVAGGLLVQGRDSGRIDPKDLKVVTKRKPTEAEFDDMHFAFRVAKHVKSNAIVYARELATVGVGAGQMSRVDSARIAALKSTEVAAAAGFPEPSTKGSVAASDAFFPFADGLETVIGAGATAVIQPGGSIRDTEVIAAADKAGIAMVMTGMRHFRH